MKINLGCGRRIYNNLELVPSTYQIRGMHTLIRDRETSKPDFCFYADRLLRLVPSHSPPSLIYLPVTALALLPSPVTLSSQFLFPTLNTKFGEVGKGHAC